MNKLGKYEILAELGRGAMGVVYKARDPFIGRLVALKTITSGLTGKPQLLDRFYQEARSAGTLQHPNIVTIFELGQEKDTPFIAMEFLEGDSLDKIVESKPTLPLFQKLEYVVKVCEALDHAHRHGVIHRDVKPGNVMVTRDGAVKVVDFGIARLTDTSMTQANMMIGSRAYMSPQLYKGERADARSDIWALGVTLYELLAYRRPFLGESEAELMFNIITNAPPPLRPLAVDCTEDLERIVLKMLEKKSEDRYQAMEDVLHELDPLCKAAQQATVAGLMTDSRQLMEANDLQRAQGMLRKVLQIDVGNSTAKSMLEKVTAELRKTQVLPKIQEHVSRGRSLLEAGHLREARAEADAALGLDSRQDTALKFRAEVEEALAKTQQLEQQLRLSKQRLAEGAVTEAVSALDQALHLDAKNPQAQELKRQIEDEQRKREKRQKLAEILHRARSLWAELNYAECIEVLTAALKDFPNDPELMKLLETARHDQAEEQKRVRFAETRKLLGEQKFAEALKLADDLSKRYPRDSTVESLRAMAQRGLQDQRRSEFLQQELAALRALVSAGKYAEATARVEPLLKEFPQEFTLMEIAAYAKGELAQQQQKQREDERQQQIRSLMEAGKYREAEDTAKRAVQDFPKLALFQQLYDEAQKGRKDQDERAEFQRRIQQIRGKINQGHLTDAADLARQTIATMGPNADVAQLLHSAEVEIAERKKKQSEQEQQLDAAKTLLDSGKFAAATQLLNQAIATQIFHPDDPRTQQLFAKIDEVELEASKKHKVPPVAPPKKPKDKPAKKPAEVTGKFSATTLGQNVDASGPSPSMFSATQVLRPGEASTTVTGASGPQPVKPAPETVSSVAIADSGAVKSPPAAAGSAPAKSVPGLRAGQKNVLILGGAGLAAIILLAFGLSVWKSHRAVSAEELKIKDEATQLWTLRQFDASEQAWRQLAEMHGKLQSEAASQVRLIEEKRTEEKKLFDQGESLLRDQKDYPGAQKAFQGVVDMNLWLVDDARRELESASALASGADIKQQEQDHFTKGQQFFQDGKYKEAAGEFDTVVTLNVPDSTIKPQAEEFLRRIRQSSNEKKLYDTALDDIKAENWTAAQADLQSVIKRKGSFAQDARKQLGTVSAAMKVVDNFSAAIKSGSFSAARAQVNAAHAWPKTQQNLNQQLHSAENEELAAIRNQAQAIESKGDVSAIEHLQDQLHGFMLGISDASVKNSANDLDKSLSATALKLRENKGDRAAFDAAVLNFNRAKEKGDVNELSHDVTHEFQKIANSKSLYREPAQEYVTKSIPNAILELTRTIGGKALVPPIQCRGNGPAAHAGSAECSQLDANAPLQWVGTPMVDFPDSARKPGKLPYVLNIVVLVNDRGDVKIEKAGNVDNEFFKKAKDSAKHWKTTVPRSGGKAVSVKFPLSITFEKR